MYSQNRHLVPSTLIGRNSQKYICWQSKSGADLVKSSAGEYCGDVMLSIDSTGSGSLCGVFDCMFVLVLQSVVKNQHAMRVNMLGIKV